MSLEPEEKVIDGLTVQVVPFAAWTAFRLKAELIGLVGPTLIKGISGLVGSKEDSSISIMDKNINLDKLGEAFIDLLNKLTPEKMEYITKKILAFTRVDNKDISIEVVFNDVFAKRMDLIYKVLWYALEVNYKSFLGLLGTGKELIQSKMEMSPVSSNS